jgi:hypothetical protein
VRDGRTGAFEGRPVVARATVLAIVAAVAGGAIHRWSFAGQTFFIDEIWVVDVVRQGRFWAGLPQPPAFFFASVAASRVWGLGESCLRLPAFLSALLLTLVPLFAWRRGLLGAPAAVAWTVLLAFSSPIGFYAARIKQYPTEALGAAVILTAFLGVLHGRVRMRGYFAVCVLLVPLLHSSPFVILGTGVALAGFTARSDRRAAVRVLLGHTALGALFAAAYLAYIRPRAATSGYFGDLYDYFQANQEAVFFDGTPRFVLTRTAHWAGQMFNLTPWMLVAAAAAILFLIVRRRDATTLATAFACVAPPVAVLLASAFALYPYGEVRLMIFAAPGLFLLVALAVQELSRTSWIAALLCIAFGVLFLVREIRLQPYNATYMGTRDLHATYAFLRANLPHGVPVVARKTEAVPLRFYVPEAKVVSIPESAREPVFPAPGEVWMLLERREARGDVLHEEQGLVVSRTTR